MTMGETPGSQDLLDDWAPLMNALREGPVAYRRSLWTGSYHIGQRTMDGALTSLRRAIRVSAERSFHLGALVRWLNRRLGGDDG